MKNDKQKDAFRMSSQGVLNKVERTIKANNNDSNLLSYVLLY